MNKKMKDKVQVGDILNVKTKEYYFVGKGEKAETVEVLKVINKTPISDHMISKGFNGDHLPLFEVAVHKTGEVLTLTHRFFSIINVGKTHLKWENKR